MVRRHGLDGPRSALAYLVYVNTPILLGAGRKTDPAFDWVRCTARPQVWNVFATLHQPEAW